MNEQLALFQMGIDKNEFANRILNDLNNLDTMWKGTFEIETIDLSKWKHISDEDKVLMITYTSSLIKEYGAENNFTYWCNDEKSERTLFNLYDYSDTLKKFENDRDLEIAISPDIIFVFCHKFERKMI